MDTLQKLIFLHRVKSASGGSVSWETISGTLPLTLLDAAAKPIKSLIRYGKVTQDGTPTPSAPVDIVCNNGVVRMVDDELPNGYKRLIGITFDGNLRYETGEALTGGDDVTMTLNNLSPSGKNVFGSYNGSSEVNFSLYIYGSTTGSYFRYGDQLKRPKYGGTGQRTITFGKSGTSGFADDSEVTPDEFTTPANTYIGMLPNSSSAAFSGDIVGSIIVSNRLEWIPCERELDGVIGYYEKYNSNFLEPVGSGTPVSLGYDTSHLIVLTVVGTPEELTVGQFDTVSGSIASFTPDATVRGLTVDIEPQQDLHGYDHPWPAGGGANIWDEEWEVGSYSSTGRKVPTQGGRIRSVNKIPVSPSTSYYALRGVYILCQYDENEEFVSFTQLGTDSPSNVGHSFTTEASTHYISFATHANYGTTYNNDIAINYPSTVTTYSPYSNICPISGWDAVEVDRTGVNLLNPNFDDYSQTNAYSYILNVVPKNLSARFTFTDKDTSIDVSGCNIGFIDETPLSNVSVTNYRWAVINGAIQSNVSNLSLRGVLCGNVFIYPRTKETFDKLFARWNIMVELGSTATAYEPYSGGTYTIQLGQTVYGGTIDATQGKMVVDRIAVDPAQWTRYSASNGYVAYRITDLPNGVSSTDLGNYPMSNLIPKFGSFSSSNMTKNIIQTPRKGTYTVYMALQENIDPTSVQFSYKIATPITIPLTPLEISVLTGQTNNIWADCGNVSVELGKNVQTASVANLYAVDDYRDEQDLISGVVTRRVGVKVLTGTENWSYYQTSGGVSQFKLTRRIMEQRLSKKSPVVCSHYDAQLVDADGVAYLQSAFGEAYLYICDNRYTSEADFKAHIAEQYAAGTPVIVMYQLAEEVTESVTPQRLTTVEGTNTVSTVANVVGLDGSCEYAFKSSGSIVGTAIVGTAVVG